MYQFYYAEKEKKSKRNYQYNVRDYFYIESIRLAVWEEHCLECAAPECYNICENYVSRKDGRCQLLINGMSMFREPKAVCGYGVHVKFKKWANIMSLVFPAFINEEKYLRMNRNHHKRGIVRNWILNSFLASEIKWKIVHELERKERRKMRSMVPSNDSIADAFVLHCYSYYEKEYRLILEVYDKNESKFRTSVAVKPGENIHIIECSNFLPECWKFNNLVKVYPEDNIEADIDFLWCDFVQGYSLLDTKHSEKIKCVVWDLDNTIWDGTLAECEDVNQLLLRDNVYEIMQILDNRGIIQSLASKNNMKECWECVTRLGISKFILYPQIGWGAKSESIKRIANDLNIGLNSIAFFDDSEFERNEVIMACPEVRTYNVDNLLAIISGEEFDVPVTQESKKRRQMYQIEEKRKQFQVEYHMDNLEFLKKCNITIEFLSLSNKEIIERCFELVQRTNQLNLSGKKYSRDEFESNIVDSHFKSVAILCKDVFGSYGISCYIRYRVERDVLVINEFAMSCRIAAKYIESKIFSELLLRNNCKIGKIIVHKTDKNITLRRSLVNIGFQTINDYNDTIEYEFSVDLKNKDIIICR